VTDQPAEIHEDLIAKADNPPRQWNNPSLFREDDVQVSYISGSFVGIVIAGFLYPICASILAHVVELAFFSARIGGFFEIVIHNILLLLMGGTVGAVVGSLSALLSIPILIFMNRSLGNPLDARSAAISAGSLAGYMPTAWVLFLPGMDWSEALSTGLFGPVLAMLMGAYGAAWASEKYGGFDFEIATKRKKRPLSVFNMMMATAWVAVTFAIANMFGGLGFAIAAAAWFVLQGFLLGIIHFGRKLRK